MSHDGLIDVLHRKDIATVVNNIVTRSRLLGFPSNTCPLIGSLGELALENDGEEV